MDSKSFWIIRKFVLTIRFKMKTALYEILNFVRGISEYGTFWKWLLLSFFRGIARAAILTATFLWLDGLILNKGILPEVDKNIFVSAIIGSIGIAGVILGLYCSNIASIYASKYSNAPKEIAIAYQNDRLARNSISWIVDYILFGFLMIPAVMIREQTGWMMVVAFIALSAVVVVSYSIAGNRAYELSDVYEVASDSGRILYRIVSRRLNQKLFAADNSFQYHFMKTAQKQIDLRKSVQRYGAGIFKNSSRDHAVMTEFMMDHLALINCYWVSKPKIGRSSKWFRDKPKYPKWHLAQDIETSLALQTGTTLKAKGEQDYWWFEDEIFSINKECLKDLFEKSDYTSIYSYMLVLKQMSSGAIESKSAGYYVSHVNWIKNVLEKRIEDTPVKADRRSAFAGVTDALSLLYLDFILESSRIYGSFRFEKTASEVLESLDSGLEAEKNEHIRGSQNVDFYKKIITEVEVEGKRITPDWVIKQEIAAEEYRYMNSLLDLMAEGIEYTFSLGNRLADKTFYVEACILLIRVYEFESKINRFINIAEETIKELEAYHIDKAYDWEKNRLGKLKEKVDKWKLQVPALLLKCSSFFALANWENRDEYPDFLGECYNHICEDAVEAIVKGDINLFETDFENLSKLMLLYQEYIKSDVVKKKDLYRVEYTYYLNLPISN